MIRTRRSLLTILAAAGTALVAAVPARAQSNPPPGVDLSGAWVQDTYLSDSPEQVAAAIRADFGQRPGDQPPGIGGRPRGGGLGRRGRGQAPPPSDGGGQAGEAAADQKRLDDLTAPVRYPSPTLTIAQTAGAVVITDSRGEKRTLTPSGKRAKDTFGETTVDVTTRWEGPQLVSELDAGGGRKITYSYSIVPTTKQLMIRVVLEGRFGEQGPFEIKQVYNRAPAASPRDQ